ncbi:TonB-dependent receptor domain-containing protein [Sphingopyxis sp.]|uniref:TonB-dependent receptor domain-containing protein n=1 Tax=Sphingopyxis sp. TaxID=1908224 RepID=UPI003D6D6C54
MAGSAAFAQEAAVAPDADAPETIVVTGSRIARPDLTANSPISVVSAEDITLTGARNPEEFLRDLPQVVPAIGSQSNNGNAGVATIDLRNLLEQRTLVLVNSKRFVPYDADGIVDVGMIPTALVQRVEIITGGASAVYGSDAIAGVVNFILNDKFEGLELDAQYGITQRGDAGAADFSITAGGNFADNRGNAVLSLTYTDQQALTQAKRKVSAVAQNSVNLGAQGSSTDVDGKIDGLAGGRVEFGPGGAIRPSAGSFNFAPFNLFQVPEKKFTATALISYEVSPAVEFFARMSFAHSRIKTVVAPTGTFGNPLQINYRDNPFLADSARPIFAANDPDGDGIVQVDFFRRLVELGTRDSEFENTVYQAVGGFRGDLSDNLNYEVFAQYGRTNRTQNFINDNNYTKVQQGVLSRRNPVTGVIECIDLSNGCVPVNIFGPDTLTPAMADYIRLDLQENNQTSQFVTGASLAGDLFTLPWATNAAGFAIGVEYRKEQGKARPDANYEAGIAPGFGSSSRVDAAYDVKEAFVEARIPIVEDRPFFHSFSLEAGFRYSDYSSRVNGAAGNSFSNSTWKIGGEWAPVEDFRFRALYSRAARAPNLTEIGLPRTSGTGDANFDPCAGANPVGKAELTALCIATGVPASQIGFVTTIEDLGGQINIFEAGNRDLTPEVANTLTFGVVAQPRFLPGFTATVDYYDIKVKNAILEPPEQDVIDGCYNVEKNASGVYCSRIFRSDSGGLAGGANFGVDTTRLNGAVVLRRGIDFSATYRFDIGNGRLSLGINGSRVLKSVDQTDPILPALDCVGLVGSACLRPEPKWRFVQTTSYKNGPLTLQLRWRYLGRVAQEAIAFGAADPSDFAVPAIGARHYFDLSGTAEVSEAFTLRAGILNLLDKDPPLVGNTYGGTAENSGNTFPSTYDPLGRRFFVGATLKF